MTLVIGKMSETRLLFTNATVGTEDAGWCEFAEFVTNHVFGDVDGDECLAVMDREVVTNEIGSDHGVAAPGLNRFTIGTCSSHGIDLVEQLLIDERTFLK